MFDGIVPLNYMWGNQLRDPKAVERLKNNWFNIEIIFYSI